MDPVEISAGRLHLRPWQESDEDAVYQACQDPEIQRWTRVPSPYTREDARAFLTRRSPDGWEAGTAASFAVLDATTGALLASVALFDIEEGSAEVGYWCAPEARGQGVISEAVATICRWGFEALALHRIEWAASVGNWASLAVAQKCGFRFEGRARMGLTTRGEHHDGWWAALLNTDEVSDQRSLPSSPTLTDGVVTLRRWSLSDVDESVRAGNDADLARYRGVPQPYLPSHAEAYINTFGLQAWATGDAAEFAITDAVTGELLGGAGLKLRMRRLGIAEVSYWTAPWARGRGVAARAAGLCAAWAIDALSLNRVELLADTENLASQRVAEKAGFAREGVARKARRSSDGTPRDMVVFSQVSASTAGAPAPG
jgi:RimJ/RimL family protein N-acetyltransferase